MDSAGLSHSKLSVSRKNHLVVAIILAATGFALLAPTRLDIAIILKEVMNGTGVTSLTAAGGALGWFFVATSAIIVIAISLTREPGRLAQPALAPQLP